MTCLQVICIIKYSTVKSKSDKLYIWNTEIDICKGFKGRASFLYTLCIVVGGNGVSTVFSASLMGAGI